MPWPWTRSGPAKDELRTIRAEVADLGADVRRLRAEWSDMFEKLVRLDDRVRKRQEREAPVAEAQTPTADRKAALRLRLRSNGTT